MLDERDGAVAPADLPRAFASKPPWQRILVLLAGPAANILFAILVLWGMFWRNGVPQVKPVIGDVTAGSSSRRAPACAAGDEIRRHQRHAGRRPGRCSLGLLDAVSDEGRCELARARRRRRRARRVDLPSRIRDERFATHRAACKLIAASVSSSGGRRVPRVLGTVIAGGPADQAGLKPGDLIVAVDGAAGARLATSSPSYVNARPDQEILRHRAARRARAVAARATAQRENEDGSVIGRIMVEPSHASPTIHPEDMRTRTRPGSARLRSAPRSPRPGR